MTPLEIVDKLSTLKTQKSIEKFLSGIEPEHEFWIAAYHGMTPFIPYRVQFGLNDPDSYGPGVPLGVFAKILQAIEDGSLNENTTIDAISAFSARCTEDEWKTWYKPVLDKRLRLSINVTTFNKFCPEQYQIRNFQPATMLPINEIDGFPNSFYIEPYPNLSRLFVFLKNKRSFVFSEDGTPIHRLLPKRFGRFITREGAVLELYEENEQFIVRDILLESQMLNDELRTSFVDKRLEVLKNMLSDSDSVSVIEHEYLGVDDKDMVRETISLFLEAGYPGVVLRPDSIDYRHEHANIVIHPTKKNTLTCTEVIIGKEGTKFEGKIEYLKGTGSRRGKKIDTLVFHGLTFDERGTSLDNRNDMIGRKFEVLSCGIVKDKSSLLFPVFQHWKE